jgi:hypothetical protein
VDLQTIKPNGLREAVVDFASKYRAMGATSATLHRFANHAD